VAALTHGSGVLTAANGFADQGDVVIKARLAADALGATRMDRTEGAAVHPLTREVFIACTNNTARGAPGREGPNPANPRNANFSAISCASRGRRQCRRAGIRIRLFRPGRQSGAGRCRSARNVRGDAFGAPDNLLSMRAACCGYRPIIRLPPAGLTRAWATTRCWRETRRPVKCGAFSPRRAARK